MPRMNVKCLEGKVSIINGMLGYPDEIPYGTDGAVTLYQAYGGYGVHRYNRGGEDSLLGCETAKECGRFLDGMINALRIARDDR